VGVPPQALWEDTGSLDRRRSAEIAHRHERPDREPPRPASALRIVLRRADDLDDPKHRLPYRGIEDRQFSDLDGGALRRRVRAELIRRYSGV
jgi:hypothetical protein